VGASAVLAATAALVVAGCGGDEGPTREEFASEANAICERHTANIEQATSEVLGGGQVPSRQEFGRLARETIIPEVRQMFDELREVEPPEELEEGYDELLQSGQEAVQQMEQDPSTITNLANFQELNRQVDELGLSRACRVGPD
jgi:hypothetical protein